MNLKQIQIRIAELTSELLTLSNDLAFLLEGEVSRQATGAQDQITHWSQLKEGDTIQVADAFIDCAGGRHYAGTYDVIEVEPEDYVGSYQLGLGSAHGVYWLPFSSLTTAGVTKVVK